MYIDNKSILLWFSLMFLIIFNDVEYAFHWHVTLSFGLLSQLLILKRESIRLEIRKIFEECIFRYIL